jgi:hypothetical protein
VPGVREFDPEAAYLQGPHFHFGIEEVATVTGFEPRNRDRVTLAGKPFGSLRARPGGALLLALLHQPSTHTRRPDPSKRERWSSWRGNRATSVRSADRETR